MLGLGGEHYDLGADGAIAFQPALGGERKTVTVALGIDLPVYPVKGYSITVPITDPKFAPESTIMDETHETHKVAVTRLGDRIRVGGTAELAGFSLKIGRAHV